MKNLALSFISGQEVLILTSVSSRLIKMTAVLISTSNPAQGTPRAVRWPEDVCIFLIQ